MSKERATRPEIEIDVDGWMGAMDPDVDARTCRVLLLGWDAPARRALANTLDANTELIDAPAAQGSCDAALCDAREEPEGAIRFLTDLRATSSNLPVIVLVSRLDTTTAEAARGLGATCVLRAPFTAADVRDAVLSL